MPPPVEATLIAELFDRYAATLEFFAAQWTTSPQDCVQEGFLELARQAAAPTDPAAWLFRVVRNRALNAGRAERRRASHEGSAARRREAIGRVDASGDAVELADLLAMLTEREREIVVLRVWGKLSWQEIADVAGSSRSKAQRDYVRALEQLRNQLEPKSCPKTMPASRTSNRG